MTGWRPKWREPVDSHHDSVGPCLHKIIRTRVETCTLAADCTSFKMRRMATRTNQLLHMAEATGSKVYTGESEAEGSRPSKGLGPVLETVPHLLLQPLQEGDNQGYGGSPRPTLEWCIPASEHIGKHVGLKSFCPLCFKFGGNTGDYHNPCQGRCTID